MEEWMGEAGDCQLLIHPLSSSKLKCKRHRGFVFFTLVGDLTSRS